MLNMSSRSTPSTDPKIYTPETPSPTQPPLTSIRPRTPHQAPHKPIRNITHIRRRPRRNIRQIVAIRDNPRIIPPHRQRHIPTLGIQQVRQSRGRGRRARAAVSVDAFLRHGGDGG